MSISFVELHTATWPIVVITPRSDDERLLLLDLLPRQTGHVPTMADDGTLHVHADQGACDRLKTYLTGLTTDVVTIYRAGLVARPVAYDQVTPLWSYRLLLPFGVTTPEIVHEAGYRHEFVIYGKAVRITVDDFALFGTHLHGHEGSPGRFAYYRLATGRRSGLSRSMDGLAASV